MTATAVADLTRLLRTVCGGSGPDVVVELGTVRPSDRWPDSVHIEPTSFPSLRAIELEPWSDTRAGEVLLELADPAEWSLRELTELAGPLEPMPADPEETVLQGVWDDASCTARAVLYIGIDGNEDDLDAPVTVIDVRVESMARYRPTA